MSCLQVIMPMPTSVIVRSYKMDNVTIVKDSKDVEHVIIDHGNDQFTSMLKSTYDELKANEAKAK